MQIKHREIFHALEPYYNSPEAIIVTGMRRTGKTTVLQYVYDKIDSANKLFIDLENPVNRKYFEEENYERIKTTLSGLGLNFSKRVYLFLDEIQFLKNLPSVVKYFIDHYKTKFFLTGSASFYLKNLFTETLAGRKYLFQLYPLSFREYLQFKDSSLKIPDSAGNIPESLYNAIALEYDEYLTYGGFPGVVLQESVPAKIKSIEDIFTSYFHLEVVQLGDFRKNETIRDLMLLLMQRIGTRLDVQKISKELGVSRPTVNEYISFLCDTFFINLISPLSKGRDTEIRKSPKIYVCDSGIVNHYARLDAGRLLENSALYALLPSGDLHYYQRKSGVEIDFIVNNRTAYEVKTNPQKRDYKKLADLSKDLGLKDFYIISKNYTSLPGTVYGFQVG